MERKEEETNKTIRERIGKAKQRRKKGRREGERQKKGAEGRTAETEGGKRREKGRNEYKTNIKKKKKKK